jgi:glycosyltransferase involved in cell wall biosynthesis
MPVERATVAFCERQLLLAEGSTLTLELSPAVATADVSLVIDIYDLNEPVHPRGHFGWWKFPLEESPRSLRGAVTLGQVGASVAVEGVEAIDSWVNDTPPASDRLLVNAVLRANTTNAIVDLDRLPAFADAGAMAAFRSGFDRDWSRPRFRAPHFVPAEGEIIHIVARDIFPRDAVGNLCLDLYRLLKQNRMEATLYADNSDLTFNDIVVRKEHLAQRVRATDQLIYFYSTHEPQLDEICALDCARKTLYFHGITDPRRLQVFEPEQSQRLTRAVADLPRLRCFSQFAANSTASAERLRAGLGLEQIALGNIKVIPPKLLPPGPLPPRDGSEKALLCVGRVQAHKKVDDFLRLIAAVRAQDAGVQAWIVGAAVDPAYRDYLRWVETTELQLPPGAVQWLGSVPEDELERLYARAGLLVSMSEDEGFCLPIFEAMRAGVPVLAYVLPAVTELLNRTGRYFTNKSFPQLARTVLDILADKTLREEQCAAQCERAVALSAHMNGREFLELLAPRLGTIAHPTANARPDEE